MKFSLVVPTRNNVIGLKKMLKSIEDTAFYLPNIEVLVAVDNDDPQREEILAIETKLDFQVYQRERSKNFSNDYYNWLAAKATGDAIQAFNDDAYYKTNCWDEIIAKKVDGKRRWFADIYDDTRVNVVGTIQPCFPMVSRTAFEALGFLLHPQIQMYPADKKIYESYKAADLVVDCLEVKIGHDRIATGKEYWGQLCFEDETAGRLNIDVDSDVRKLRNYESIRNDNFASV